MSEDLFKKAAPADEASQREGQALPVAGRPNAGLYREMQKPFESRKAMEAAFEAFFSDVSVARVKHRITDVHCIVSMNVVADDGGDDEGEGIYQFHLGDRLKGEAMAAYSYGFEKRAREETFAKMLAGPNKRTR